MFSTVARNFRHPEQAHVSMVHAWPIPVIYYIILGGSEIFTELKKYMG